MFAHYTRVLDTLPVTEALHSGVDGFEYTEVYETPTKPELMDSCSTKAPNRSPTMKALGPMVHFSSGIITSTSFYVWHPHKAEHSMVLRHLKLQHSHTVIPVRLQYFPSRLPNPGTLVVEVADFSYGTNPQGVYVSTDKFKLPSGSDLFNLANRCPDLKRFYPLRLIDQYGETIATIGEKSPRDSPTSPS